MKAQAPAVFVVAQGRGGEEAWEIEVVLGKRSKAARQALSWPAEALRFWLQAHEVTLENDGLAFQAALLGRYQTQWPLVGIEVPPAFGGGLLAARRAELNRIAPGGIRRVDALGSRDQFAREYAVVSGLVGVGGLGAQEQALLFGED